MLLRLATTPSTMDTARQLLEQGDTTTTIVLADEQTAGRGRHNRPWITFPAPYGHAATFIIRPQVGPHFPLLVALALYDAVKPLIGNRTLALKWPNDLLLEGRKAAGILCENLPQASIVGIGLNIRRPEEEIPQSFQGAFLEADISPENLAKSIWACMQPLLTLYQREGWSDQLHNSYLQSCATIGQTIVWQRGQPTELTGYARSLTKDGHLELVGEDGTVHVIHSGEIFDTR